LKTIFFVEIGNLIVEIERYVNPELLFKRKRIRNDNGNIKEFHKSAKSQIG